MNTRGEATEGIAEKLEMAHDHLERVDGLLDELADDIEEIITEELEDATVETSYDIETGRIEAKLPYDTITSRINERVELPYFVGVEDERVVIKNISEQFPVTEDGEVKSGRQKTRAIKQVIDEVEERNDDGAPLGEVLGMLTAAGLTKERAEIEIEKLKQKGEVYEPKHQVLRTT
ncbi:hypothetical protein [Halorubellus sp. PRR65]|uniref:hypothetical protein n=1 Tax=Halorubellus sp. PRR65 TaxID=3098148 RepID=UPI002B25FF7F|nr:hypothetical protein [Halorubellus sp. PRR65]